jgi:hypothetical protein
MINIVEFWLFAALVAVVLIGAVANSRSCGGDCRQGRHECNCKDEE